MALREGAWRDPDVRLGGGKWTPRRRGSTNRCRPGNRIVSLLPVTLLLGPIRTIAALSLAGLAACGGGASRPETAAPAPAPQASAANAAGSLNRFAAERVMVIPAQGVSSTDPLGWRARAGDEKALLQRVDSTFEAQLSDRGLSTWAHVPALARAARRNPTYITDPYQLRAAGPIRLAIRARPPSILEPLSSQLRGLAGVSDARYALVPFDVGFVPDGASGGSVKIALAIVDVRAAQVVWSGIVAGDHATDFSFAAVASAISRAADLVVPRH